MRKINLELLDNFVVVGLQIDSYLVVTLEGNHSKGESLKGIRMCSESRGWWWAHWNHEVHPVK
jgi:hypothetical protein